jgi:hypoxanthine phosphoribosyltransferase
MPNVQFSWREFDYAVENLAWQLKAGNLLDQFDWIYGIPRGGLVLAVALSHKLDKPLVETPCTDWNRILVVDDISDSGETLMALLPKLSATIHYNTQSKFRPLAWVHTKRTMDWIVYPWEV